MEYTLIPDREKQEVLVITKGTPDIKTFLEYTDVLATLIAFHEYDKVITDHRLLGDDFDHMSYDEIRGYAKSILKYRELVTRIKAATVCAPQVNLGLARMWAILAASSNIVMKHRVFFDIDEATKWIRETK
jgi:hypothetical protein